MLFMHPREARPTQIPPSSAEFIHILEQIEVDKDSSDSAEEIPPVEDTPSNENDKGNHPKPGSDGKPG